MADSTISNLPATNVVNDTDLVPMATGGVTTKVTVARINKKITTVSTASQSPTAATLTQLSGSNLTIPSSVSVNIGTLFQWKLILTKTAAGTASPIFYIRAGTTGTTSDTAIHTFTLGAETAAADTGRIDVLMNFRSVGSGTSAVSQASLVLTHSLAATGLLTVPAQTVVSTSSGYASTTANLIFSMSVNSGTSNAFTFSQVIGEAVNV